MALFKISKGSKNNLPTILTEGFCWYTYDDSKFYIDFKDENGVLTRKALNAQDAETLMGASLATILNSSNVEIPTSQAVYNALSEKLDSSALPDAINDALTQAKASGEFDGEDGYTPVRGTDYWTDADKAEIKSYVDEAILNGEW